MGVVHCRFDRIGAPSKFCRARVPDLDLVFTANAYIERFGLRRARTTEWECIETGRSLLQPWDCNNGEPVASGIYFYTLTAGDFAATRKMLILK